MKDKHIVALYLARDEQALEETRRVYHRYLTRIALGVLHNPQDTESRVKMTLARTRGELKTFLEKEGIVL